MRSTKRNLVYKCRLSWALAAICAALLLSAESANAAPILYVSDDAGRIARVDVVTGEVEIIGNTGVPLTDIAFDTNGNLFGISFDDFYSIDLTTAASATLIGRHGISNANALTFGPNNTLYAAGFDVDSALYRVDPETGLASSLGNTGVASAGDLAFNGGQLYLAALDFSNVTAPFQLVRIDLASDLASVVNSQSVLPIVNVVGLATGDDGMLYGVSNTGRLILVDLVNGASILPLPLDVFESSQSFSSGASALPVAPELVPVPEPSTILLVGAGLLAAIRQRRRASPQIQGPI